MTRSTTSFLFPDLNVWLALALQSHVHHSAAATWFGSLSDSTRIYFCRITQIGFLRLLTTKEVMAPEPALTQHQAWENFDCLQEDDRILFADEPAALEKSFRATTQAHRAAPKEWSDSYLVAFAHSAGYQLVTFDLAISAKSLDAILLTP